MAATYSGVNLAAGLQIYFFIPLTGFSSLFHFQISTDISHMKTACLQKVEKLGHIATDSKDV